IFEILSDSSMPTDDELPDTGVGLQWERILSPLFITSSEYGTRSSSIVLIATSGQVKIMERTFFKTGNEIKKGETRKYSFMINH
ncbi:MAG: NRDE family protein, partial [Desulfobacterales bacterium]|nr:NRDE family protein [Desulfobacterales bacterium]